VSTDGAGWLVDRGIRLVGTDFISIETAADPMFPVHRALLAAGIAIVEHMCNLGALPDAGFRFFAVPPAVKRMASFPVRAFALVRS